MLSENSETSGLDLRIPSTFSRGSLKPILNDKYITLQRLRHLGWLRFSHLQRSDATPHLFNHSYTLLISHATSPRFLVPVLVKTNSASSNCLPYPRTFLGETLSSCASSDVDSSHWLRYASSNPLKLGSVSKVKFVNNSYKTSTSCVKRKA